MENNAIVYSFNKKWGKLTDGFNESYHYQEMMYSIYTIRKYNKHIPIYVYLAPPDILNYTNNRIDKLFNNVYINYFTPIISDKEEWPSLYIEKEYWHCLQHRWYNALQTIVNFNLDDHRRDIFLVKFNPSTQSS